MVRYSASPLRGRRSVSGQKAPSATHAMWDAFTPAQATRAAALGPPERSAEVMTLNSAATGAGTVLGATAAGVMAESAGFPATFALAALLTAFGVALVLRW